MPSLMRQQREASNWEINNPIDENRKEMRVIAQADRRREDSKMFMSPHIPYVFRGRPKSAAPSSPRPPSTGVVLEDVSLAWSREDTDIEERAPVEGGNGYWAYSNGESVNMATIIPPSGIIFNYADVAPSPCKDYCQIMVSKDQVIFRMWKISLRNNIKVSPQEVKESREDFLYDDRVHSEITRVFGKHMLEYLKRLCEGHLDYLPRLQPDILIRIIRYLDLEDVSRLACVSKQFQKVCTSDDLWEKIYMDHSETMVTDELRSLAEAIGWRKLFFTNKIQLQMQLRRQAANRKDSLKSMEEGCSSSSDMAFLTQE